MGRVLQLLALSAGCVILALAQTPAADQAANQAYAALRGRQYDEAISLFHQAITADPKRVAFRKDLAYTLLKVGESEEARDQFAEVMRLDPADTHVALEY
ncbi:MAG: tetratricopeptide repeat protein, partial [Bryobacteraceae bacterium]